MDAELKASLDEFRKSVKAALPVLVENRFGEVAELRRKVERLDEEVRQMRRFAEAWSIQNRLDRLEEAAGLRAKQ